MKKSKVFKTLMLAGACLCAPVVLFGCSKDNSCNIDFRVENGYIQVTEDGKGWKNLIDIDDLKGENGVGINGKEVEFQVADGWIQWKYTTDTKWTNLIEFKDLKGENAEAEQYTITYDYGIASRFFQTAPNSETVKSTQWLTTLPDIKSDYVNCFKGWFIKGTNKQIMNYDFIGGNVTLEARFYINEYAPAGLYDNGKMSKTWAQLIDTNSGLITVEGTTIITTNQISGELIIDNSITTIEEYAFNHTRLTEIFIPSNVTTIANKAFINSNPLERIVVMEDNAVYDSRDNCNAIIETATNKLIIGCNTTIIPSSVTEIEYGAFYGCESLTEIIIPSGVTCIGVSTFVGCTSLTKVIISNNLSQILGQSFYSCESLTEIVIPSGVTYIADDAFERCYNLKTIVIDSATIANGLTGIGVDGCGDLLANATTVYIKSGFDVSGSTYFASNFMKQLTSDRMGYDKYVLNTN